MDFASAMAVFVGAGFGALARWWLAVALNPLWPNLPLGTLVANTLGGFLIGVVMAVLACHETLSPLVRLALVTGFLGGMTTFSTFSAETVAQFMRGEAGWAFLTIAAHLLGALLATWLGLVSTRWAIAQFG